MRVSTHGHVKALVVHFVEMKYGTVAMRWDQAFDNTEAVLSIGAVF